MEQYRLLAECLLPAHMLDWFDLKNVRVEKKDDTQVIHLYLDENEQTPDNREDLRPNGFRFFRFSRWSDSKIAAI